MPYESLLTDNRIEEHTSSSRELHRYMLTARAKVGDAAIEGLTADTRFTIAYDAVRATTEAVIAAEGYRLKPGEGQHAAAFTFLAETEDGRWEEEAGEYDDARQKRNLSLYGRFGEITETEADELLASAQVFIAEVAGWLREKGLLSREG